jgi:TolA-binding protein
MVRALAVSTIVVIVVLFAAAGNAQSIGSNHSGERPEAISWEMFRQRQVEMQLEMQRQQLEIQRQRLELQQQQLEMQRQQLEIQRQQQQLELEKQRIGSQKKQAE